jgi:DMSO/TMAO reductase YedYZ molybdopterin-dependent catalytic subunit
MLIHRVAIASAIILDLAVGAPLYAAQPAMLAPIVVTSPSHAPVSLSVADLAGLPKVQINVAFMTEHGMRIASFEGPLLWAVLQKAGAVDPAMHREQVSRSVAIVGRDGYRAVLAVGEIAPEFEGKQVLLAERMDGHPLGPDHLRVVVPRDKRGGRSVRDVARIAVSAAPAE